MKRHLSTLALLLFAFTTILSTSCKKDEEEKPKTRDQILVGKKWQMKAATIDPSIQVGGGLTNNFYNQLPACVKDDFTTFNANGKFVDDEGTSKCVLSDPQTTQGDWLFNSDKTVITFTYGPGDSISWTIKSISDSEMVAEYQQEEGGTVYTITATFRPI